MTDNGRTIEQLEEEVIQLRRRVAELEASEIRRAHAEEVLRKSEEQLRAMTDVLPVLIYYVDARQVFRFGNRVCEEWYGRPLADMYGRHIKEILGETNYRAVRKYIEIALSGFMATYETAGTHCDGGTRYVSTIYVPHTDGGEQVKGFVVLMSDISERKKEEEILMREREYLSSVLDANPVATFVVDRDLHIALWNRACTALTGIPKEAAIGKRIDLGAIFQDPPRQTLAELILEMNDDRILPQYGNRRIRRNSLCNESYTTMSRVRIGGEERLLTIQATRLRNHSGDVIGAIQCVQDITEQERLERQLRQVQKMEAIGTLAGGIAHDFNNILMIMVGYAEMALRKVRDTDPVHGYLEHMLKAGNRAKDLVKQILAFSRQTEQEKRPVEIGPIVKEALKLLRASLPSTIEIRRQIELDPGLAPADPIQIHQVLMNLCANAAHAMEEKGGVLNVSLDTVELAQDDDPLPPGLSPGLYLRLTVSDTGHGMTPDVMERIFDPFFTTKGPGEGTGMGLAVVHGIVNSYGGTIKVDSKPGEGSTFQVYFPKATCDPESCRESFALIPSGTGRLLFVDNQEAVLTLASHALEQLGYAVKAVSNAEEAARAFEAEPSAFDLIITSQDMPQMPGTELAARCIGVRRDIPVILCMEPDVEMKKEDTATSGKILEIVGRPAGIRELAKAIRKALDKPGA